MQADLDALEQKIQQFVALNQRLRRENMQLRQQLAESQADNRRLTERMDGARQRVEALMRQIPEEEQ